MAVGQPGHRLAAGPATMAQLAAEPFIDYPPGWGNRAFADRAFAAAGLDREVLFEAAEFTVVINLVRGGLGVAFLLASVAASQGAGLAVIEISATSSPGSSRSRCRLTVDCRPRPVPCWPSYCRNPTRRRRNPAGGAAARRGAAGHAGLPDRCRR